MPIAPATPLASRDLYGAKMTLTTLTRVGPPATTQVDYFGGSDMTKILLVQGANLSFLGRREPAIYGTTTAAELDALLQSHASKHGYALDIFYSNIEGEAINRIYQVVGALRDW